MSVIPDAAFAQSGLTEVPAGRVALLEPEPSLTGDIASIRVLDDPAFGNLTVNPDMTLALVLSDTKDTGDITMRYAVTFDDGREEIVEKQLTVTEAPLENGWALGDNLYDLRTDADGKTILETGDNHYKVHVSGSEDALTKADIAALEGISVSQVNGAYLASSDYGSTPELALAPDAMRELWWHTTVGSGPSSSWMLIERGYEYELDDLAGLVYRKSVGENEFNPIVVTAYGEGEDPVIQGAPRLYGGLQKNIVISDLHLADGLVVLDAENVLVENVSVTGGEVVIQTTDGVTIKDSAIYDADPTPPPDGNWAAHADREQGLYMGTNDNILIENTLFDDNGWEEGGAPPSQFSHNVYIQTDNSELTFRDNISMQGSSFGGNIRSGGFFEDNVFLDNNAALGIASGNKSSNLGNYNLLNGNVVTSGAHKEAELIGALAWGIDNNGVMTTMHDNIVAHLANPDDPSELAYKETGADGVKGPRDAWYDDTVVYNWTSAKDIRDGVDRDVNTENVDPAVADVTTIQRYTAELLGQETATIEDLSDYLRANFGETTNGMTNADLIAAYFREGFGIEVDLDTTPGAARFVPDGLADGMRWDNRMNWQDDALPEDGDNVDLAGNWVYYNGTHEIGALDMGEGGKLHVTSGYLEVDGPLSSDDGQASEINISHVGQFFTNDYEDLGPLEINVDGGRFANIGAFYGQVDLEITDGQTLLAMEDAHFAAAGGSRVSIQGSDAKVGFDGAAGGPAVLGLSANMALEYVADADGFSSISEFHSGQFENEGTNVESAIDLGNVTLRIDATAWAGALQSHLLMRADEIVGEIGTVDVIGLGAGVDARIVVDYQNDTVFLETFAGANGTSDVSIQTFGGPGDFGGSDTLLTALQSPLPGWPEPPAPAPAPEPEPEPVVEDPVAEEPVVEEPVVEEPVFEEPVPEPEQPEANADEDTPDTRDALNDLDSNVIRNFGQGDSILIEGAELSELEQSLTSEVGTDAARLAIAGGDTFNLFGDFSSGGFFMTETDDGVVITFEPEVAELAEGSTIQEDATTTLSGSEHLTGAAGRSFEVTLSEDAATSLSNSLGYYQVEEDGDIVGVTLLSDNAGADKGETFVIEDVAIGNELGFFILQDGADWAGLDDGDSTYAFLNDAGEIANVADGANISLARDGVASTLNIFHGLHDEQNADNQQMAIAGLFRDSDSDALRVAFEDSVNGDDDYQDVVLDISFV